MTGHCFGPASLHEQKASSLELSLVTLWQLLSPVGLTAACGFLLAHTLTHRRAQVHGGIQPIGQIMMLTLGGPGHAAPGVEIVLGNREGCILGHTELVLQRGLQREQKFGPNGQPALGCPGCHSH